MVEAVCRVSVALAVAGFIVFAASAIWAAVLAYRVKEASAAATKAASVVDAQKAEAPTANAPKPRKLLKAAAALIDAIVKAGPSLSGLVASIAFLAIAARAASRATASDRSDLIDRRGTALADLAGKRVVTASRDTTARVWDVSTIPRATSYRSPARCFACTRTPSASTA